MLLRILLFVQSGHLPGPARSPVGELIQLLSGWGWARLVGGACNSRLVSFNNEIG
jgi:hypothetical protein